MFGLPVYITNIHHHYDSSETTSVNSTFELAERKIKDQIKIYGFGSCSYTIEQFNIDGEKKAFYYLTNDETIRFKKASFKGKLNWSEGIL